MTIGDDIYGVFPATPYKSHNLNAMANYEAMHWKYLNGLTLFLRFSNIFKGLIKVRIGKGYKSF